MSSQSLKITSVLIAVITLSVWFWITADNWIHGDIKFALVSAWIWPLAAIVIASAVFGVALLVLLDAKWRWLVGLGEALTMLIIFGVSWLNMLGVLLIILLTAWAGRLIAMEARDHAKLNTFLIMRRGLSLVILPLLIAVSFQYYQSPALARRADEAAKARSWQPSFQEVMNFTVQTFLKSQGEELTESQQEEYKNQVTHKTLNLLSYYAREYAPFLPPVLAFGLFIVLWGLAYVFIYLSILVGMLIFWALRKTGFVKIEVIQVPSEFIKM